MTGDNAASAPTPQVRSGRLVGSDDVPPAVAGYFDALNAEDWPALEALWCPDARLTAPGSRPRSGTEEIMAYFRPLFGAWQAHHDQPVRVLVANEVVVVEVSFTGRSSSGRELTFAAVDVFELRSGAIATLSTWYDLHWLRKQL